MQQLVPGALHKYLLVDVLDSLREAVEGLAELNSVESGSLHFHAGYVTADGGALPVEAASFGQKVPSSIDRQPTIFQTNFQSDAGCPVTH